MNSTYSIYMEAREGLGLLERYNILAAMEQSMSEAELRLSRGTYAVVVKNDGHAQCSQKCTDDADGPNKILGHDTSHQHETKFAFDYQDSDSARIGLFEKHRSVND